MQVQHSKVDSKPSGSGPRCSICDHPQLAAIEVAIASGLSSLRDIAGQFQTNKSSVDHHKTNCLPERLKRALERRKAVPDAFLSGLEKTAARCDVGLRAALSALDASGEDSLTPDLLYRMGPAYAAQASRARELLGQATGRLNAAAAPGAINLNLQIVMPRAVTAELDQAAIDVTPAQGVLPDPDLA